MTDNEPEFNVAGLHLDVAAAVQRNASEVILRAM